MATNYTSLLGLALPTQGELSGTWGDVVNNYISTYVDSAVAGTQIISGSQTAVTLSVTNGASLSQAAAGATGSAQYQIIRCSGNPASLLTITAPAASKVYLIINATSTSQSVKIVGTGPTTGVTIATGKGALVAWNGSDFVTIASNDASVITGVLAAANGGTGQSSYTTGDILYASGSTALSKLADVATGNALISGGVGVAPSYGKIGLTTHVSGTLPVSNGGTGITTTPTNGQIPIGNGTNYVASTITAGSGISITNGSGAITIATSGGGSVTSVAQSFTGGLISVAGSPITSSGTLALTVAGTSGGIPYFSSASTWESSGALTQYGVVYGGGAGAAPVATAAGTTGQVLTATTGSAPTWATPASTTPSFSLLSTTTLTAAATFTISGLSGYNTLYAVYTNASSGTVNDQLRMRVNGNTGSIYNGYGLTTSMTSAYASSIITLLNNATTSYTLAIMVDNALSNMSGYVRLEGCNSAGQKMIQSAAGASNGGGNNQNSRVFGGFIDDSAVISSITFLTSSAANFDNGTLYIYGSVA